MPYPTSATYPTTAHYPGVGVAYPSTAQYPGATPFAPPTPPPVGGYTDWYESREINLTPPYNPDDAGDVAEWFSLFGSNSLTTGGTPGSYAISGLNGLPVVALNTRELDGNESFTGGSLSFVFVASGGIIGLSSSGDNFEVAAAPGNFTINFQGSPILTGPAVDSQFHIHCVTYDSVSFTLQWWMDGALVGVAGGLTALALLNGPLSFNDTFIFAFVGWQSVLSWDDIRTVGQWYAGIGAGAPATGLTWASDPIGWITFALRLQTNTPFAKMTPINLFQDVLGMIPAVVDGDPLARENDFVSALFVAQSNTMKQPTLRFEGSIPVCKYNASDLLSSATFPLTQPFTILWAGKTTPNGIFQIYCDGLFGGPNYSYFGLKGSKYTLYAGVELVSSVDASTNLAQVTAIFDGASSALYENDTLMLSGNAGAGDANGITIGDDHASGANGFDGENVAIFAINGTANLGVIQAYLMNLHS